MDTSFTPRPNNDSVARRIIALICVTSEGKLMGEIETLLNTSYPSRRARSAARAGIAHARTGDKATSIEAAGTVRVAAMESKVLRTLDDSPEPLTSDVISQITSIPYKSVSPRMGPLEAKGMVKPVGVDRSTGRGRTLYGITEFGRGWLQNHFVGTNQ